jgi:hypothetical protein
LFPLDSKLYVFDEGILVAIEIIYSQSHPSKFGFLPMDYPLKSPTRDKVIIIKVTETEKQSIKENAGLHTGGNVSQWIRKSAISFAPPTVGDGDAD